MFIVNVTGIDILKYLAEKNNISTDSVLEEIQNMKREEILQKHPYKIWQGKDGRWRTHIPDSNRPDGRRLVAKSTLVSIEEYIISDYHSKTAKKSDKDITLEDFYPIWFTYKESITKSSCTMRRHDQHWKKYYLGTTIVRMKLIQLDALYLTTWAHDLIKSHSLTAKEFGNMKVILTGCIKLAIQQGILSTNPWALVEINPRFFRVVHKKSNITQVYLNDELPKLYDESLKDLESHPERTDSLAILLNLQLGLRIGELVALKWTDIEGQYIHIQRMESKQEHRNEDGTWGKTTCEVVEHTKTNEKGERLLYLTKDAFDILEIIRDINYHYGYKEEYIFCDSKGRTTSRCISDKLEKYCRHMGIPVKSSHKLRKTVASLLNASGVPLDEIRRVLGHTDEKTTLGYIYNPFNGAETEKRISSALSIPKTVKSVTTCNHIINNKKTRNTA